NLLTIGNAAFYSTGIHENYYFGAAPKYSYLNAVFPSLKSVGEGAFYKSAINYFEAPQVESIGQYAFSYSIISGALCDKLTSVSNFAFYGTYLMEADFPAVKTVGASAFADNFFLVSANMPKCEEIESCSFYECFYLSGLNFPSLKRMAADSFDFSDNIRVMFFPELEDIYSNDGGGTEVSLSAKVFSAPKLKSFCSGCFNGQFEYIEIPSVEIIDIESFGHLTSLKYLDISGCYNINSISAFKNISNVEIILAPNLIYANSLPDSSSIILSSALKQIGCNLHDMTFYGIPGSYAEQYADENGHTFIPVPYIKPESVPNVIDSKKDIEIDAIGFNLSYQWLASYDGTTKNTIILDGETNKVFNLKSAKKAPYYFCIVTCEENGNLYTATTKVIQNTKYSVADYSALEAILETLPEDFSIYTEESVAELNEVIADIDKRLDVSEQATVDGYVETVSNAIAALKLKEHMVSFIADNKPILSYELEYGSEITDIPPNPDKTGYTFSKWTPDIPPAMPNNSLTFTAEFDPVTYYASFMVDGEEIEKVPFTVESISITEPAVPEKEGYENGRWEDYALGATDITINAVYDKIEGTCSHVDSNDDGKCDKCGEPMTYTKDIIVDGVKIGEATFTYGDSIIDNLPDVPAKTGYTGEWEYTINGSNLDIHPQYTPITYYATFKADGNQVGEKVPFTVESESISEPEIPDKEGYTGKWSEYIIAASDITVNAEYIINEYTVSFAADDKIIKSEIVEFGSKIKIPEKPQKAGYIFKEWLPKVPETMPAKDMTFYAVFEEVKQPDDNPPEAINPSVDIRNFAYTCTVDYRTTITFTAITKDMPKDVAVVWYIDGQKFGEGEEFTVKEAKEAFTVQAKIVDENGNVLNATETELIKVKTDFFSRIIAFFRMLFGKLPIVEQ
ncbi:MAG: InlB B-repeat-containing protein, partial [Clostridia bacterium]|nr:InlB B-repeat-containing protein [Clostridia bacterium]